MADTRVFKIYYSNGKTIRYGNRYTAVNSCTSTHYTTIGRPFRIEATDKDARLGWTDVSFEFPIRR